MVQPLQLPKAKQKELLTWLKCSVHQETVEGQLPAVRGGKIKISELLRLYDSVEVDNSHCDPKFLTDAVADALSRHPAEA
jgi:hypothetical protein